MKIPTHIAIIMDGNGRWASAHKLPRAHGHEEGAKSVESVVKAAQKAGIKILTLYAFSTENWARPKMEVSYLMNLLERTLDKFTEEKYKDVKLIFSGRKKGLSSRLIKKLDEVTEKTKKAKKLTLNLCLNYGSRQEIIDGVNKLIISGKKNISEHDFKNVLYQNLPDPDIIVRTSGEERLSNFLLWQAAYSEFYFTKTLWPDFKEQEFNKVIQEYQKRNRRFGAR